MLSGASDNRLGGGRPPRVLVVDDEPQVLVALQDLLEAEFDVTTTDEPEKALRIAEQDPDEMLWIRDPFLEGEHDFGKHVVHGHTPVERPEIERNRINVDTGAFMTGRLTCAVLERERVRFLTAT